MPLMHCWSVMQAGAATPPFCLSLTMPGWITRRNHELFNFHLEELSRHSSHYERICSIGYNSHLNGSLHLLGGN